MAVSSDGEVVGSVSGGCVEGAVVTEALSVLAGDRTPGIVTFGYSDDEAFAVGLTCGGTIRLYIEELDWFPGYAPPDDSTQRLPSVRAQQPVALATIVDGPGVGGKLLVDARRRPLGFARPRRARPRRPPRRAGRARGRSLRRAPLRTGGPDHPGGSDRHARSCSVFVESWAPPPQMWIFGAVDFTAALAKVAKVLGYRVVGVRRPRDLRHPAPLPDGGRGARHVAGRDVRRARRAALGTRRGVHPHPRPEVRRAGRAGRARHQGRLHRGDGQSHDTRQAHATAGRGRRHRPRTSSTG